MEILDPVVLGQLEDATVESFIHSFKKSIPFLGNGNKEAPGNLFLVSIH